MLRIPEYIIENSAKQPTGKHQALDIHKYCNIDRLDASWITPIRDVSYNLILLLLCVDIA